MGNIKTWTMLDLSYISSGKKQTLFQKRSIKRDRHCIATSKVAELVLSHASPLPSLSRRGEFQPVCYLRRPTKLGTIGPGYCNSSWHFDRSQLSPIEPQLEQEWGNVHTGDRYVLWQHEWEKHGTCAAQLPSLGSELLYFSQGLAWVQQYNMSRILLQAGISPDTQAGYDAGHLSDVVRNALGKDPAIECLVHKKTGVVYLFEIRICFDKSLQLTDCDGIKATVGGSTVITNCPTGKAIMYPVAPPQEPTFPRGDHPQRPHLPWLLQLLSGIHWLQWLTM